MELWPQVVAVLTVAISLVASGHAVLYKRDTRSVVAWVGLIWLAPVVGAVLYVLLGINRIRRKAKALRAEAAPVQKAVLEEADASRVLSGNENLAALSRLVGEVVQLPLLAGNLVEPLNGGDAAYEDMLEAIDDAKESVMLSTYIFDDDLAGRMFEMALVRALGRGVNICVIIDSMGARYSFPPIVRRLRKRGLNVARFLPTYVPRMMPFANLRNHRKIMVVDGVVGFTGGMNIRHGHMLDRNPRRPVKDLHFRVEGPVVAHLRETFAEDWYFCTGRRLEGEKWFPTLETRGEALARGIPDGPDEDFEKLYWTMHGAMASARRAVKIMTPYFLPDQALITVMNIAALRGVEVDIVMPEKNNQPMVKWASTHMLWQVLQRGCRAWFSPPPFDHSKLMIVDEAWVLFGSGNWDPRTFRLNFEFNLECYDAKLASSLSGLVDETMRNARQVTLDDVNSRSFPVRLRDGVARLFSPFM